jgi:hypothetical protein
MDPVAVRDFQERHARLQAGLRTVPAQFIRTGVFVQALEDTAPGLVQVTGRIWQRYPAAVPREARGLLLPEALSADLRLEQEFEQEGATVQHYSFRAVVRQEEGRNNAYPFDWARIRLRLWPKDFFGTQTLVPDLDGYTVAAPTTLPGVDPEIAIPGWDFVGSEFAYVEEAYNTNFGIRDFAGQRRSPELVFNLTLRRRFLSPFIATFLPLAAVAGLLYILLLTTTRERDRFPVTGYNYLDMLCALIGLFFSLIVAQFNVRGRIPASGVLKLEWFYFVLYGFILVVSALSLRFAQGGEGRLCARDQELPKLAFWPALMVIYYLIALRFLV